MRGRKANAGGPWNGGGCKLWRVSFPKKLSFHPPHPISLHFSFLPLTPKTLSQDTTFPPSSAQPPPPLLRAQGLREVQGTSLWSPNHQVTRLCVPGELPDRERGLVGQSFEAACQQGVCSHCLQTQIDLDKAIVLTSMQVSARKKKKKGYTWEPGRPSTSRKALGGS